MNNIQVTESAKVQLIKTLDKDQGKSVRLYLEGLG